MATTTSDTLSSLLRAILAEPERDDLRLYYADALDEDGQSERAEFIRVQMRLAEPGMECAGCKDCRDCLLCCLVQREKELLRSMPDGADFWLKDLPQCAGWNTWEYRRGFVECITATSADWFAHAEAVLSVQPIREVALIDWPQRGHDPRGDRHMVGLIGSPDDIMLPYPKTTEELLAAEWPGIKFILPVFP